MWSEESKQLSFFCDMYIPSLRIHRVTEYKAEDNITSPISRVFLVLLTSL